jgi:hypothetical protein
VNAQKQVSNDGFILKLARTFKPLLRIFSRISAEFLVLLQLRRTAHNSM